MKELKIQYGKSTSVSFTDLADGTYYVAETDKDGNPVENTDFGFDVSYDGDITVSFTEQNTDSTLAITNDMTERNPEYNKYSKKGDLLMKLSARNQLKGKIININQGAVNSIVSIDIGGGNIITATISCAAVEELGLKVGSDAYAVIKATNVMVGIDE